jgi:hypothetical protein
LKSFWTHVNQVVPQDQVAVLRANTRAQKKTNQFTNTPRGELFDTKFSASFDRPKSSQQTKQNQTSSHHHHNHRRRGNPIGRTHRREEARCEPRDVSAQRAHELARAPPVRTRLSSSVVNAGRSIAARKCCDVHCCVWLLMRTMIVDRMR